MKYFSIVFLLLLVSCSGFLSDEELQKRFDKAYDNHNWENAKPLIDEIILRHKDSVELHMTRALITSHLEDRNNKAIIKDLDIFLKEYPDEDVIKVFRFQTLYLDNQLEEALKSVNDLIDKKGKSAYLLAWKGNIAFASKKFDIAERAYKERLSFPGSEEDFTNTYYYWVFSKHFGGNTESALWELAAMEDRGMKIDYSIMTKVENNQLVFDDLDDFVVPNALLDEVENAINNYCSDIDIFQGSQIYRPELLTQYYRLEKAKNLKEYLDNKDEIYALNLSYSNINELPEDLLEFKNLQYLNLSGNRFKDKQKLFDDLAKLPNLIMLELDRCYLRSLPDNINKLKGLVMLSMEFNDFRVLNENLGQLTNLKYLGIGANGKLRDLPKSIGQLRCLQALDISPNGMNRLRDELSNCSELVSIVANAGTIKTLPENMGLLVNLKHANLAANKIIGLPNSIGELVDLEDLSLGSNDIKELPKSFDNLKNLAFCGLSYNRFKTFPEPVLGLDNVQNLWLHNNSFTSIPKEVASLPKLTHLLIDHQVISEENIELLKTENSQLRVIKEDSRKLVRGPRRKE